MITLTDDTFLVYAIKNYNNPECTGMSDFEDDVKRFKYLKRLFNRYETSEVLSDRLIINHLIVLYNVFDVAATTMLFYKTEERHWPILKTFLVLLNRMPMEQIVTGGVKDTDIPLDFKIINILRKI